MVWTPGSILGGGDPEYIGDRDPFSALFEAGMELTNLMNELADERRKNPTDDLTSQLVHNDLGEELLAPNEIAPFFILLAVAGNDTTRTAISHGMHFLSQFPEQRKIWQEDLDGVTPTAVEEIIRFASPVAFMRRTVTHPLELSGQAFDEGDPFGFDVHPEEQLKFDRTLEVCGDGPLGRVLELGCAVGTFTEVPETALPAIPRKLLAHDEHMTVTVEAFHGCPVEVDVLQTIVTPTHYSRRILLRRQRDVEPGRSVG